MQPTLPQNFDTFFNLNFIFSLIAFILWIGYLISAFTLIGKTNELSQTLETRLSGFIKVATLLHFVLVVGIGLLALVFVLL